MQGLQQGGTRPYTTLQDGYLYMSLVQGTPSQALQHGSGTGSVVIISIHPPGSPSLDCFHFLYISGSVCVGGWGGHTVPMA